MSPTSQPKTHIVVQLTALVLGFIVVINLLAGNQVWPLNSATARAATISDLVSQESLNELYNDPNFHTSVQSIVQVAAESTKKVAEHTQSENLHKISTDINQELVRLRSLDPPKTRKQKRGILKDIGALFSRAGSEAASGGDLAIGGVLNTWGTAMGASDGSSSTITGLFDNVLNGVVGALSAPAFFLGSGLGGGVATGLGIATPQTANLQTDKAAKQAKLDSGGINSIAQNLGSGIMSVVTPLITSALPSLDIQSVIGPSISGAAFSLAQGIGNGTASGLNLTMQQFAPSSSQNGSIAEIAGNLGLGITQPIASNINIQALLKQAMAQAPTIDIGATLAAAGRGLGNGATAGLGISKLPAAAPAPAPAKPASSKGINSRQAQTPPATSIDIPGAVEGFTGGLASSFLGSTDITKAAQMAGLDQAKLQQMLMSQLPQAAVRAAKGLGQGAAQGLGILNAGKEVGQPTFQPGATFDVPGIAEDFTTSLTSNFLGSANISAVTSSLGNQGTSQLAASLPAIVQGAGKGIGAGAAKGLGLSGQPPAAPPAAPAKRQAPTDPGTVDPGALAEGFTSSLVENFLGNANLSSLAGQFGMSGGGLPLPDTATITAMLAPAAFGLSSGLGEGAAVGLGLKADSGVPVPTNSSNGGLDIEQVTRSFGKGLTQQFLANGTADKLLTTLQTQSGGLANSLPPGVSVPAVAEGFARGLVDGAMVGISSVGGIQNLISGNVSMNDMMQAPPPDMGPAKFNDTIGGAATALGRGFGSEGVILVAGLVSNGGILPPSTPKAPTTTPAKRSLSLSLSTDERGLVVRQATGGSSDVTPVASGELIGKAGQLGIDVIGCSGVGGFISIGLGLVETGTIKLNKLPTSLDPQILALLPDDPINLRLAGNTYEIKAKEMDIKINGLPLIPFAIILVLHILLVILAFFILLPLFMTMNSLQRIGVLFGKPVRQSSFTWQKRIFFFMYFPTAVAGIVMGIVAQGNTRHLRSTHGIVGTIALVFTLVGGAVYFLRSRNPKPVEPEVFLPVKQLLKSPPKLTLPVINGLLLGLLLQLANFAFFSGWSDLANVSFCATEALLSTQISMGLAAFLMFALTSAFAVVSLRFWLEQRRMARQENGKTVYSVNPPEPENEKADSPFQSRFSN